MRVSRIHSANNNRYEHTRKEAQSRELLNKKAMDDKWRDVYKKGSDSGQKAKGSE